MNSFTQLLLDADVTVIEASKLFKVSRTTIYHWMHGGAPNQPLLRQFAAKGITVLQKAVTAGDLPMRGVRMKDRRAVLKEIIQKHL